MTTWFHAHVRQFALWLLSWVDACPTCGAPWAAHRCPYVVLTPETARYCEICGVPLPIEAVRTHAGKWRCREHKSVEGHA